nr:DNA/RNA non-specific endonuclease [Tychonema sp. LEGE 06208]
MSIAPTDWLNLKGPGATTSDLTPTFQWQFAPSWEDVKEVNLFVSTFEQGKGLLPWDKVVDLSDSALLPGFSETQKRQLLSKPWNGYDDFNPNRILTATWKKDTGKWYGHDGITPLDQPLNDPANTSTNFTLPRSLTAGQNYNFAVEAVNNSGAVTKDLGQFKTLPPFSNSPFSSVSVLTHGFTLLPNQSGIPDSFFQMANKIATVSGNTPENSGLIMRYDKPTGNWIPIDLQGREITNLTGGLKTSDANYLSTLANNLKKGVAIDGKEIKYLNQNKPLVLLPEWSLDRESVIPDVGFSEGAADALFASMVQLDLALGGKVGEYQNNQLQRLYDSQGKLIRQQGDLFNSPLHFMGFSRGTVVNSEIVQRLGTFFPQAGGVQGSNNRDLQMTTVDPHDFYQPNLKLNLLDFIATNFSDFYEPKVQVWNNVTFADNYYQTVADPNGVTATPNGRALGLLPQEELDKNPKPAGLNFPKATNGDTLGKADREILLGTRNEEPGRINSRIGFTKDDVIAGTHKRAFGWYAGTVDLDLEEVLLQYPHVEASEKPQAVNDMLGKMGLPELFDPNFPAAKPWYDNGNGEGVGEGWFYSVLGGGKEQRTFSSFGRVPVSFDNTLEAGMRGDYAVPTLFNGNFDQFIPNKSEPEKLGRNAISQEIPGWSFHGGTSKLVSPINNLVEWSQIAQQSPNFSNYLSLLGINSQAQDYQPNYALKLGAGESITHNRFVVPDWGVLRLDLHVPESSLNKGGRLKVYLEEVGSLENVKIGEISLKSANPQKEKATRTSLTVRNAADETRKPYDVSIPADYGYDKDTIGYGSSGFETFHIDVPPSLRGKVAKLTFELQGAEPVYIDNAFFKSEVLKWGNPTEARNDLQFENNFLIEKPQYTLSYNRSKNTVNWVGWKLDKTWLGTVKRPQFFGFAQDPELVKTGWYSVKDSDYDALSLKDKDGQVVDNRKGDRYADGYIDFEINENGNYIPILEIDRGHMAPAADRSRTTKDLYATFLTTNLLPQESSNNRGIWETIENQVRAVIRNSPDSNGLETYMFAGGYGYYDNPSQRPYTGISQNSNLDPLIQFPVGLWKVVMTKDKNTELPQYAHYGIYLGNDARSGYQKQTIQNLEDLLNGDLPGISPQYQFLSNLPESPGKERIKNTIFERLP